MKSELLRKLPLFIALLLAAVLLQGCSTVPVTGRSQLNLLSQGQELELGITSFEQIKKETKVSKDPAANALLQKVGKQIAQIATKDMPNAQWEFVVFDSPEANAFCLPGGKVGVYTGILPITKTEAGLATVVGHEIAHATARHGGERMSEAMVMQTGGQLLGTALSSTDPTWQGIGMLAWGVGTKVGRELPHSREQESEADQIGLSYMARAGYNPREAVAFWQRFSEHTQGGDGVPTFLRTHPVDKVRIQQLEAWMPGALEEFKQSQIK